MFVMTKRDMFVSV